MIEPGKSPFQSLTLGYTIVYPEGRMTGHAHDDMEEVYFIVKVKLHSQRLPHNGIDNEKFPIKEGDAFYVPLGKYHVTYNTGILSMIIIWVTGKVK